MRKAEGQLRLSVHTAAQHCKKHLSRVEAMLNVAEAAQTDAEGAFEMSDSILQHNEHVLEKPAVPGRFVKLAVPSSMRDGHRVELLHSLRHLRKNGVCTRGNSARNPHYPFHSRVMLSLGRLGQGTVHAHTQRCRAAHLLISNRCSVRLMFPPSLCAFLW